MKTGIGDITNGYAAQGITTIRWGTEDLLGVYVVTRFNQKPLVDNQKLQQGSGLTSTRVQLNDGWVWEITVRDDTAMIVPRVGTLLTVVDAGNLIPGSTNGTSTYSARVIESGYDISPKGPGERTITAEKLLLLGTNQ